LEGVAHVDHSAIIISRRPIAARNASSWKWIANLPLRLRVWSRLHTSLVTDARFNPEGLSDAIENKPQRPTLSE
jgi:hypothetical protein